MELAVYYTYLPSPIGELLAIGEGSLLSGLYMQGHKGLPAPNAKWQRAGEPFDAVRQQLDEYFAGRRQVFDLPLRLNGTAFQQRVWRELARIPFGTTMTYAQLAFRIERPSAARAVGHANSRNPISIIVPCHRVIGSDGVLTGYAGGLEKKRWLLELERRFSAAQFDSAPDAAEASGLSQFEPSSLSRSPSMVARSVRS